MVQRAHNLVAQYIRLNDVVSAATPDPLDIQALVSKGQLPTGTTQVDDMLRRNLCLRMQRIYYTLKLTVLAAETAPIVSSPTIEVVNETRYSQEAQTAWKNVVDKSNPHYLDQHIGQFPEADTARTAFSLRYELTRNSQSIATYNEFIARYPDRAATPQAVGDVWQLYRADNRLSGYLDFIRRYPQTPHAVVAKYHAQQLAFEYAWDFDTVTDYDAFLEAFPDAPQIEAVRLRAAERAKADEEALYEAEKKQHKASEFTQ